MGALSHHKALKAVQAGASCIDIYFEDFSRYGLFALAYMPIMDWFGTPRTKREEGPWWERKTNYFSFYKSYTDKLDYDSYDFFLKKGALKNFGDLLSEQNYFYAYLKNHPDYDDARKERNALQYLKNINCPMLIVGGWNDEQNIYGTIKSYEAVSKNNKAVTRYVVGPWTHGDYRSHDSLNYVGNIFYGKRLNQEYFKKEFDFFQAYLNNGPADTSAIISLFNTGDKNWFNAAVMPATATHTFYLAPGESYQLHKPGKMKIYSLNT
jgi:putative CocE/NonD family hydrolase